MNPLVSIFLFSLIISIVLTSCAGYALKIPIDKNKLSGDFSMEFTGQKKIIKNNEYFNLSEMNLQANSPSLNKKLLRITNIDFALKNFKNNNYINYDVIIKNPSYPKPYYGKIAFINTSEKMENVAVSRYREISIDASYFQSATRGRAAIVYEYYQVGKGANTAKIPTWLLVLSDEPL